MLVLFPQTALGSGVAQSLARAGHAVHVLLDASDRGSASHHSTVASYLTQEMVPLYVSGSMRNVSALAALVESHGITSVVDTRPLRGNDDQHMLAFAQRLADIGKKSGVKRSYIYTSGCVMHSLDTDVPADTAPPASALTPAAEPSHDVPAHESLTPQQFEKKLLQLGRGRGAGLHTLVLRPGVVYGAAAWASSPLRHWVVPATPAQMAAARASAPRDATPPVLTPTAAEQPGIVVTLPASLASRQFLGIHSADLHEAFVALASASPADMSALTGETYDLLDETRVSNAQVHVALARAAGVRGEALRLYFEEKEEEAAAAEESSTGAATGALLVQKAKSKLANMVAPKADGDAAAAAAAAPAVASPAWGWTGRVRCNPSKSGADKFRTVTRWKPVHKKINDEEKLHTYVRAIREHAHTHTHATTKQ